MACVIKCSLQAPRCSHTDMQIKHKCRPDKSTDQIATLAALVYATCCSRISNQPKFFYIVWFPVLVFLLSFEAWQVFGKPTAGCQCPLC